MVSTVGGYSMGDEGGEEEAWEDVVIGEEGTEEACEDMLIGSVV